MTEATTASKGQASYRIPADSSWASAWKIAAAVAALGIVASAIGASSDVHRFAFSYLFAFIAFLMMALGGIFFGIIQWLTGSSWSITVRRVTEYMHWPIAVFALLFVPIALNLGQLYPWVSDDGHGAGHGAMEASAQLLADAHGGEQGGDAHAAGHGGHGGHSPSEALAHAEILAKKAPYLNLTFFAIRCIFYFVAWTFVSRKLFNNSVRQDEDGDPKWTVSSQRVAPVGIIVIALTSTFAAFDWLMGLEPSWFSTIFGVNFFADCIVSLFAVSSLILLGLRRAGHLGELVNKEHFHDLGKLLFGFLVFWAYVNFSQFMLIWYAAIPEETTYYHLRWGSAGWQVVTMAIVFGHFVVPFFFLLSRNVKRALPYYGVGCAIVVLFHFVMVYWLVMPYYAPNHLSLHWLDLTCLMAVGGVYASLVFYRMSRGELVAIKDPRLSRAVEFVNA